MAEDVINVAIEKNNLSEKSCVTQMLKLYGHDKSPAPIKTTSLSTEELNTCIKKSINEEMCLTVEDFLSRRTRQLLLDAKAAINMAPQIAQS